MYTLVAALSSGDLVFLAFPALIVVGVYLQQRKRRQVTPLRGQVLSQAIRYRCPVSVKYWHQLGWSTKTLAGMEVIVRDASFQVTMTSRVVGAALGSEWYFTAAGTSVEISREPPTLTSSEWIIVQSDRGEAGRLAISAKATSNLELWNALLSTGARGLGPPPSH